MSLFDENQKYEVQLAAIDWWNNVPLKWKKLLLLNLFLNRMDEKDIKELTNEISQTPQNMYKVNYGKDFVYEEIEITPEMVNEIRNIKNLFLMQLELETLYEKLPPGIEELNINWNKLTGILDLSVYKKLKDVKASRNQLTGIKLPQSIEELDIDENKLTGTLDLSHCENLKKVYAYGNQLTGIKLPQSIEELDIDENKLTGILDLSAYENLKEVYAYENQLTGIKLPKNIENLYIFKNKLTGTLDLSQCKKLKNLSANENQLTGIKLPKSIENLYVNKNKLAGILDLSHCEKLKDVNVNFNQLTGIRLSSSIKKLHLQGLPSINEPLDLSHLVDSDIVILITGISSKKIFLPENAAINKFWALTTNIEFLDWQLLRNAEILLFMTVNTAGMQNTIFERLKALVFTKTELPEEIDASNFPVIEFLAVKNFFKNDKFYKLRIPSLKYVLDPEKLSNSLSDIGLKTKGEVFLEQNPQCQIIKKSFFSAKEVRHKYSMKFCGES